MRGTILEKQTPLPDQNISFHQKCSSIQSALISFDSKKREKYKIQIRTLLGYPVELHS